MNGSYSVPIGNSRSPLIECDRPSAESRMNRLFSAMPSSMCWPGRREFPVEGRGDALALEHVGHLLAREQVAPVHPRPEIGRDGHVGRGRDDALDEIRVAAAELVQQRAEPELRRHRRLDRDGELAPAPRRAAPDMAARLFRRERHAIEERLQLVRRRRQPLEPVPLVARPHVHRVAQAVHLRRRHHAGVVVLVAGERQPRALDGVADEAGRPVVRRCRVERLDQRRQVVPAEIAHQPRELVVRALVDQPRHRPLIAEVVHQALAPRRAALERQRRIELVRAVVDPGAQRLAARLLERGLLQRAVLDDHDVPAERLEQRLVARPQAFADHRVEALAIVVDHPPAIAQALLPAFEHRLEDVALVHLGIADQRDHAAFRPVGREVRAHVILHQRGEQRLRDAEADRAGGEIHVVGILGARGIALRALVAAERFELLARLLAEQILDRVEVRARMRLHGDAVLRAQHVEIERRHDGGERGGRGLMPADLQPVGALADVIGVMDGPAREPENFLLQFRQRISEFGRLEMPFFAMIASCSGGIIALNLPQASTFVRLAVAFFAAHVSRRFAGESQGRRAGHRVRFAGSDRLPGAA